MTVVGKAMNGVFALQKIPSLKPDIIILDLEMPEMNGIDFLKEKNKTGNKNSCNHSFLNCKKRGRRNF